MMRRRAVRKRRPTSEKHIEAWDRLVSICELISQGIDGPRGLKEYDLWIFFEQPAHKYDELRPILCEAYRLWSRNEDYGSYLDKAVSDLG